MDVRSDENKDILYQILIEHPLKNIDINKFLETIDNQVHLIYQDRFKFKNNLVNMNKEVIRRFSVMEKDINKQRKKKTKQAKAKQKRKPKTRATIKTDRPIPTQKEQKNVFDAKLKNRQDDFIKLVNPHKPEEINFKDPVENGTLPSLDTTLEAREKELRNAMQTYNSESAAKWIGNNAVKKNIRIDTNSSIELDPEIVKKRVSFKISEIKPQDTLGNNLNADFFLKKLKKKEGNNMNNTSHLDNTNYVNDTSNGNNTSNANNTSNGNNTSNIVNVDDIYDMNDISKREYLKNIIDQQKILTHKLEMLLKSL